MEQLYLVAEAGGARFAMPAGAIGSVVPASDVVPVPRAAFMVAGVAALRSNVVTVIDTMAAIDGRPASVSEGQSLIVVNVDGFLYGLAVDEVHDVCECPELPEKLEGAFEPGWHRISTGVIEMEGRSVVVINPAALVVLPESKAA
ncbi:chemotaxis protein CheW [Parasphingopyxis lamellibrachiae]|uniref:Purine-binding chemotaxis protein CheW n=1 Tax=Parasphingopyxis lamellibrachiae TaxID=680125 RepID=A0A3D9FD20_9SPHN|nr:chemotaxis protein CheW [Parasphingopyxis lamellibrachiae]RED15447.1 purine-binding chemotaxis protein CheW [Parasphingopyxis lamellibrachiae]